MLTNRRTKIQKRGVLWKIRKGEKEIAVAEDKGCLVKTYSCIGNILNQIEKQGIVEGAFIAFEFNTKRRVVEDISYIVMRNNVSKWANRFAFVKASIAPLLKLHKNGRLAECKFVEDPQEKESSAYIGTSDLDFKLKNMQYVSFSLNVNIQNTRNLRNRPYLDLVATQVKPAEESEEHSSELGNTSDVKNDNGLDDWFSKRMSSPRRTPSKNFSKSASRSPTKVIKSGNSRERNNSIPTNPEIIDKRDPCSKYFGPAADPKTSIRVDNITEDVPENYNDFCATFKSNEKPQHEGRCLRCDDGAICTHKPPRKSNNVAQGSIVSDDNSDSSARNSDEKIERLENENDYLKRQLEEMRSQMMESKQPSSVSAEILSLSPIVPQKNISYTYNEFSSSNNSPNRYDFPYDNVFTNSLSPSPEPELFREDEPYYDQPFVYGGKPSSSRSSEVLSTTDLEESSYFVNKSPLIDSMLYPLCDLEEFSIADNHSVSSASSYSNGYAYDSRSYDLVNNGGSSLHEQFEKVFSIGMIWVSCI